MFEHAIVAPVQATLPYSSEKKEFSLGQIAEALVFYDKLTLVGDHSQIGNFITAIGPPAFSKLVDDGRITLFPISSSSLIAEQADKPGGQLFVSSFHWDSLSHGSTKKAIGAALRHLDPLVPRPMVKTVLEALSAPGAIYWLPKQVEKNTRAALLNQIQQDDTLVHNLARSIVSEFASEFDSEFASSANDFEIRREQDPRKKHLIFRVAGSAFALHKISLDGVRATLGVSGIAHEMLQFFASIATGMALSAEFVADPRRAGPMLQYIDSVYCKVSPTTEIAAFQQYVLNNAKAIGNTLADAVGLEERWGRALELAHLLHKRERFSAWLKTQTLDESLLSNYIDYVQKGTWIDRLPVRLVRVLLFGGAAAAVEHTITGAAVGVAAGLAVESLDVLVLDKLSHGWKPNHFVLGPLATWVRP